MGYKYHKQYNTKDLDPNYTYYWHEADKHGQTVDDLIKSGFPIFNIHYDDGTEEEYNAWLDKSDGVELSPVTVTAKAPDRKIDVSETPKKPPTVFGFQPRGWSTNGNGIGMNPIAAAKQEYPLYSYVYTPLHFWRHVFTNYDMPPLVSGLTAEENALNRSRLAIRPNDYFDKSWDLDKLGKLKGFFGWGPTCTNTATSFYYPNKPTAGSINLLNRPEEAGFRIIPQSEAVPGSLIVMSMPDNSERHTVVFDQVYRGPEYTNQYGDIISSGDTLVNYSNGGRKSTSYRIQRPMNKVFPERIKHTYLRPKK